MRLGEALRGVLRADSVAAVKADVDAQRAEVLRREAEDDFAERLGAARHEHERGAVHDPGRVARRVHVVDPLEPVVALQRHRVEAAHLADRRERGIEPGQRLG